MPASVDDLLARPLSDLAARARAAGHAHADSPWLEGLAAWLSGLDGGERLGAGILEVHAEGFGFLRSPWANLLPSDDDIYVSQSQIRRFGLRTGDSVIGRIREPKEAERYAALLRVERVNGAQPLSVDASRPTPAAPHAVAPSVRVPLARHAYLPAVDWLAPLGLGQRGLVVGSHRGGRGVLLRALAEAARRADLPVVAVLLAARPDEVELWRGVDGVEILATPLDEQPARHAAVAELAAQRASRQAEVGEDVVVLIDSVSRLLRSALSDVSPGGRTVEGLDVTALQRVRRVLRAGAALHAAGSVTLLATADADDDPLSAALVRDLGDALDWCVTLRAPVAPPPDVPDLDARDCWSRHEAALVGPEGHARRRAWRAAHVAQPTQGDPVEALRALAQTPPLDAEA